MRAAPSASAGQNNLSRFFSAAGWEPERSTTAGYASLLQQTRGQRAPKAQARWWWMTRSASTYGTLFEHVDRHYDTPDGTYPLAHNPVTSFSSSGPVRFPLDWRLYRRYRRPTGLGIAAWPSSSQASDPTKAKERAALAQGGGAHPLQDSQFRALHDAFRTKVDLSVDLVETAIRHKVPFGVLLLRRVVSDRALGAGCQTPPQRLDQHPQEEPQLETASFVLKDAAGSPIKLASPHIAVNKLVPLIPASAFRPVNVASTTYGVSPSPSVSPRWQSAPGDQLPTCRPDGHLRGACHQSPRLECPPDHCHLSPALANGNLLPGWKRPLGLDTYRMRSAEAIAKHWCLVFVALLVLAPGVPAIHWPKRPLPTPPLGRPGRTHRSRPAPVPLRLRPTTNSSAVPPSSKSSLRCSQNSLVSL